MAAVEVVLRMLSLRMCKTVLTLARQRSSGNELSRNKRAAVRSDNEVSRDKRSVVRSVNEATRDKRTLRIRTSRARACKRREGNMISECARSNRQPLHH